MPRLSNKKEIKEKADSLKDIINMAVELQLRLHELSKHLFPEGDFNKEFFDADERLQEVINNDLCPMVGAIVIDEAYEIMKNRYEN